jgi:hypothetical protein
LESTKISFYFAISLTLKKIRLMYLAYLNTDVRNQAPFGDKGQKDCVAIWREYRVFQVFVAM